MFALCIHVLWWFVCNIAAVWDPAVIITLKLCGSNELALRCNWINYAWCSFWLGSVRMYIKLFPRIYHVCLFLLHFVCFRKTCRYITIFLNRIYIHYSFVPVGVSMTLLCYCVLTLPLIRHSLLIKPNTITLHLR